MHCKHSLSAVSLELVYSFQNPLIVACFRKEHLSIRQITYSWLYKNCLYFINTPLLLILFTFMKYNHKASKHETKTSAVISKCIQKPRNITASAISFILQILKHDGMHGQN